MNRLNIIVLPILLVAVVFSDPLESATIVNSPGNVTEFTRDGDSYDIHTTSGAVVRIQVLKSDMFRISVGPDGKLVDEGSRTAPIVVDQDYPPVNTQLEEFDDHLYIATNDFALQVRRSPLTLALYRSDKETLIWRELKPLHISEEGSYQTLSSDVQERFFGGGQQNGSFEFKGRVMEISYSGWEEGDRPSPAPFYMSGIGYGVLRNTWSDGQYDFFSADYLMTKHQEYRFDAYYFVGHSINHVLDLYTQLTGRAGLLPRWAFEYGDADCYNDGDNTEKPGTVPDGWSDGATGTTPDVINTVAAKYREHDMPGGWILPNDGYGCGYTDLPTVVEGLRSYGFHTGLWTEDGVKKIAREVGQAGTRAQKLDVAWTGKGYQFAMDANHDASQGILDNSDSRPFVWTVMGWAGIQRYAVTWTGDQSGSWDFIRWHIPTLIGSGLSGMVYSTGDVDGIFGGSPETFTRDLQWKCFTPVLMGMSGWSKVERKHPWWFDEPYRSINRKYLKLKMRLMPYVYTIAREAEQSGAPIVRSLLWDHPEDPRAFSEEVKYQFFLGKDLLIAPVFRSQSSSGGLREGVYLPEGVWIDFWDGTISRAGSDGLAINYPVTIEDIPVFVRAGAILPMYPEALYDGEKAKDVLTLDIYPLGKSEFTLYEDDGNTRAYKEGEFTLQEFRVSQDDLPSTEVNIEIEPVTGSFEGMLERRAFVLQVHNRTEPKAVLLDRQPITKYMDLGDFEQASTGWYFAADDRHGVVYAKTDTVSVRDAHHITMQLDSAPDSIIGEVYPVNDRNNEMMSRDNLLVVNRPTEEPGYPLEQAFDDDFDTWFRTVRAQSVSYGPHEFVLSLKERHLIDGFQIAPRNDKWWKYGNVYEYELYVGDANGNWGDPIMRDTLGLSEEMQTVRFEPTAGSLVRFRILSTHDMKDEDVDDRNADTSYNALAPVSVNPATISEFRLLEHKPPDTTGILLYLSGELWSDAQGVVGGNEILLNGLTFSRGLSVQGNSRIDYRLQGDWQTFRVETGIDDQSTGEAGVRFQVYGDDMLLYQTRSVKSPTVEKFEIDIRGIKLLSLRTVAPVDVVTAIWANPEIGGFSGNTVGP